ncbi:MAG: hypothetical protein R3B45_03130 [Bdellovibrionota bacterium]
MSIFIRPAVVYMVLLFLGYSCKSQENAKDSGKVSFLGKFFSSDNSTVYQLGVSIDKDGEGNSFVQVNYNISFNEENEELFVLMNYQSNAASEGGADSDRMNDVISMAHILCSKQTSIPNGYSYFTYHLSNLGENHASTMVNSTLMSGEISKNTIASLSPWIEGEVCSPDFRKSNESRDLSKMERFTIGNYVFDNDFEKKNLKITSESS